MNDPRFERLCRTPSSEVYRISDDGRPVGRVDLHFAAEVVYGTLALSEPLAEEDVLELIELIDEDLVLASEVAREDLIMTVYRGEEVGTYSDEDLDGDEEDDLLNHDHR